uniref:Uncharacterized protein n=1 Tax=Sphaerodactylus townsendi TaxID=933632 RepID=A0ACB8EXF0_9SAUR
MTAALFCLAQGCGLPTTWLYRAVVVNAAQLASYSQSKQFLLDSAPTSVLHSHSFCYSSAALIAVSGLSDHGGLPCPADIAMKTRQGHHNENVGRRWQQ